MHCAQRERERVLGLSTQNIWQNVIHKWYWWELLMHSLIYVCPLKVAHFMHSTIIHHFMKHHYAPCTHGVIETDYYNSAKEKKKRISLEQWQLNSIQKHSPYFIIRLEEKNIRSCFFLFLMLIQVERYCVWFYRLKKCNGRGWFGFGC